MKKQYSKNKTAKVGDNLVCPSCGCNFVKRSYQQVFCKSKPKTQCKDKYWNTIDPNKRNNKNRISPASKRWLDSKEAYISEDDNGWGSEYIYKD